MMPGFNAQDILSKQKAKKPEPKPEAKAREHAKALEPEPAVAREEQPAVDSGKERVDPAYVPPPVQSIVSEPQEAQEGPSADDNGKVSYVGTKFIKDLPAGVVAMAKKEFPDASNKDALTAYVYMKSGKGFPVDQKIRNMVSRHNANTVSLESLADNITAVQARLDGVSLALSELEIAVSYILFDRLGFRRGNIATVDGINFLEGSMEDLLQNLRRTTVVKVKQDAVSDGRKKRPMNEPK